jgi:hypothetical protein
MEAVGSTMATYISPTVTSPVLHQGNPGNVIDAEEVRFHEQA